MMDPRSCMKASVLAPRIEYGGCVPPCDHCLRAAGFDPANKCPECGAPTFNCGVQEPLCIFNKCNVVPGDQEAYIAPAVLRAKDRCPRGGGVWQTLMRKWKRLFNQVYEQKFGERPLSHREIENGEDS